MGAHQEKDLYVVVGVLVTDYKQFDQPATTSATINLQSELKPK